MLTPALLAQAPTSYVDVVMTAWVLAGLHGVGPLRGHRSTAGHRGDRGVRGLLAGTKGTGLVWALALSLSVLVVAAWHWHGGRPRWAGRALPSGAMACGLPGARGWWYVRSAISTGNPLYPFSVTVGGPACSTGRSPSRRS